MKKFKPETSAVIGCIELADYIYRESNDTDGIHTDIYHNPRLQRTVKVTTVNKSKTVESIQVTDTITKICKKPRCADELIVLLYP